ncbi:MAG TPA: cysteine desulfurase family protein, partial [Urbifossiella sp.]|nr:cysteine desulfurase family protein [Urbifossiella sp.]
MRPIDLDHNATTPTRPEVWDAVRAAPDGNPSSAHRTGRAARRALDDARERVAAVLGCEPDEVIFTSGATEANNLAVFGLCGPGHVIASPLEHPCVFEPLKQLAVRGATVEWLPASERGVVDPSAVRARPETRLVSVMLANHETGAIQPVRAIVDALPPGVPVLTDAAQAVGKMPVCFRDLGIAALTASAHKFGGPKSIGLLILRRGTPFKPTEYGGHHPGGRRPGTEPVPLAAGLATALELAVRERAVNRAKWEALRKRFWQRLQTDAGPVVLNGPEPASPDALPTTLNVSFPGCRADLLLMALDLAEVACSAGSACSSGSLLPSPVLRAMGLPDGVVRSAIRFS